MREGWEKWNMSGTRWSKVLWTTYLWRDSLTAVKLQMFGGKTRHVWHPIRTPFFVSCSRLEATDGIPRFWVATPAAARAKIGLKWMTNILQLVIKGNELTNQTKRYLVGDTWQLFSTKNWWARGLLSVPKKLGTLSRSNGTWNVGFRGEGKPQIQENNLSQQRLENHPQNLNEDSIIRVRVILIDLFG